MCERVLRTIARAESDRELQRELAQSAAWNVSPAEDRSHSFDAWPDMIRRLATLGFIEAHEYELIVESFRARDRVVHGLTFIPSWNFPRARDMVGEVARVILERAQRIWQAPG
jgi:hypothetical protein